MTGRLAPALSTAAATTTRHGHHLGGRDIILLVVVVILIVVTGFLALSETAITRMSKVHAVSLAEEGRRGASGLLRLVEQTERVLPVVLFALELCTLVAATLVGVVSEHAFGGLGVVISTVFEVVVIFVVAELAPKTWAVQNGERAALLTAPIIRLLVAFAPLRWATRGLIWVANKLLPGKGMREGPYTTEEMIRAIADTAAEEEVIEHEERRLIHSIIDFGDTIVRDIMVPRPDMVAVESRALVNDVIDIAIAAGFSRIPVFGQGVDDITGLVLVKDLMRLQREGGTDRPVTAILRDIPFVPESKRVAELMAEMQANKAHLAIVVDEYGGTAGLVTLEDILEELVGEITDEYDEDEPDVERHDDGSLVVNARLTLDEVNDLLGQPGLPEGDWDTVGGLVYSLLGHVPSDDEEVEPHGYRLAAQQVQGRRIGRVRIVTLDPPENEGDEEAVSGSGRDRHP